MKPFALFFYLFPENLEQRLELNIQRFDTFSKMRSEVVSSLEQKASKNLADSGGAVPMEIDYVQGKGKGKDKPKVCYVCNKTGHISRDCWRKPKGQNSSSSGKRLKRSSKGSKGSHKGSKGSGKGKSSKGFKRKGESVGSTTPWMVPMRNLGAMRGEPEAENQDESWNVEKRFVWSVLFQHDSHLSADRLPSQTGIWLESKSSS